MTTTISRAAVEGPITRDSAWRVAMLLPAVVLYSLLRRVVVPPMYLPYRAGLSTDWAYGLDATIKRSILPITERSDQQALATEPRAAVPAQVDLTQVHVWRRDGRHALSQLVRDRLLLVLFRGSWCSYSRRHLSELSAAAGPLADLGVDILAVSARDDERWWNARGIDLPMAWDGSGAIFERFGVKCEPTFSDRVFGLVKPRESVFLLDRQGVVQAHDVRDVSDTRMRQSYASSALWLELCRTKTSHAAE